MLPTSLRFAFLTVLFFAVAVRADALDLVRAQKEGQRVAAALAVGEGGDWSVAQAMVADADALVRDIVLWRKLRDGGGTPEEYRAFVARRSTWPGQKILERVALGAPPAYSRPVLGGGAEAAWHAFSTAMDDRDYPAAEKILLATSTSAAALGRPELWGDARIELARMAARERRGQAAYALASRNFLTPADGYDYSEAEWVAGWVALRLLGDPKLAIPHFRRFRDTVETPISVGRGGYWLGRAYEAAGDMAEARRWYADAGQYQTSFYGQLAAERIGMPGDRQLTVSELPDWHTHPAMNGDEVRLATVLYYAGEDSLAMQTFAHLGETLPAGALAPLANLVLDIGEPHFAVRIAKKAAERGVLIYPAYYPVHAVGRYASRIEPALALSIARQETELNPRAISPAGALGLMQLMPRTALKVAGWLGEAFDRDRLLSDWRYNARLGETYLAQRVDDYGGSYVLAAAAYNAGPNRVDEWVGTLGDPRLPGVDVIDWIENIPFAETRNYVERVIEGLYVYRTRLSGKAGPMTISKDLARGHR